MFVRCCFVYIFLNLIDKVSLLDQQISGVEGGSVILSCSYTEKVLTSEEINVFWRYNENKVVYDILGGIPSTETQDAMFKDRIDGFPLEFKNGNFSLRLSNLKLTDSGQFLCDIDLQKKDKVTLIVKAVPSTVSPSQLPKNSSMKAQPERIVTLLIAVFDFFYFALCWAPHVLTAVKNWTNSAA